MLILLGGFLGSGRRPLAKELSRRFGLHRHKIPPYHSHVHGLNKDRMFFERRLIPETDSERTRVFTKALADFPVLSKMYPDMVIDRAFHRAKPRDLFISGAAEYFSPVVFVWIEADEKATMERLQDMKEKGEIGSIEKALAAREREMREFQTLPEGTLRFRFHGKPEEADALWALIQTLL